MRNNVIFNRKAENKFRNKKPEDLRPVTSEIVRREIGDYITSHEAAGVHFDTECQEIVYDARVTFLLRKEGGFWIITDVLISEPIREFLPVFIWKRIWRGARQVIAKVLAKWRTIRGKQPAED